MLTPDLRHSLRLLTKTPAFSAVAVLTLALGIGANTAIFSVIRHVLLNTLPYKQPDRIVTIWLHDPNHGFPKDVMSYPRFEDTRALKSALENASAFTESLSVLSGVDEPQQLLAASVTPDFFRVLGVTPKLGRDFTGKEEQVAVLSHGLWTRQFGADPAVIGRRITLNARPYEVVGVMPATVEYPNPKTEIWIPLALDPQARANRGSLWLNVVARLKDGVSLEQAKAQLDSLNNDLGRKFPQSDVRKGTLVIRLHDDSTENVRTPLLVVTWAVVCVLLIACANVASMMMARAAGRAREMSIRLALGAGASRLLRQMITESLVLFLIGGIAGLLVAVAGVAALVKLAPAAMPQLRGVHVDWPVALFAFALSLTSGLVFGLMPGFTALREKAHDALKQRGAAAGSSSVRHVLVVAQIALAIILLGASGLLIRSFVNLSKVQLGFRPDNLLTFRVTLPEAKYPRPPEIINFFNTVNDRLRSLPGAKASGGTTALLLGELPNASGEFTIEGRADKGGLIEQPLARTFATPGFFSAFGQPLLDGREFNPQDGPNSPPVAIINESLAKRFFEGRSPVGRRFKFGRPNDRGTLFTIVGVVADTRRRGLDRDIWLEAYTPLTQASRRSTTFIVRTAADPLSMVNSVREVVRSIDRDQPISAVAPMDRLLDDRMAPRRFVMLLLTLLAGSALLLAAVGLYGVLAYLVTLRTQEFGVRLALGATGADVLTLVSTHSVILVAAGIAIGIAGSLAATRLMSAMLYNVSARDPLTLALAAVTIGIAAALATLIPALRASRVDPMVALRYE